MAVRINGPAVVGNVSRSQGRGSAKKASEKDGASAGGEKVKLSSEGTQAANATRDVSDVDEAKVAELRAAIQRGEYQPDLKRVAERIIQESFLFGG